MPSFHACSFLPCMFFPPHQLSYPTIFSPYPCITLFLPSFPLHPFHLPLSYPIFLSFSLLPLYADSLPRLRPFPCCQSIFPLSPSTITSSYLTSHSFLPFLSYHPHAFPFTVAVSVTVIFRLEAKRKILSKKRCYCFA